MPYKSADAQKEYQRRWVASRRAAFFSEKTCEWCGSSDRLELHHRDPSKKLHHSIWSWGQGRRETEIAKCFVLCRDCHEQAHGQARRLEAELRNPHGSIRRYWIGCRCEPCLLARREYQNAGRKERAA